MADSSHSSEIVGLIVTYGDRADLSIATCEAALLAGAGAVVIVANKLSTGSAETLQNFAQSETRVRLVENRINAGSAGGFAQGIPLALKMGADFVWMLDDDNLADSNALRNLLSGFASLTAEAPTQFEPTMVSRRTYSNYSLPRPGSSINLDIRPYVRAPFFKGLKLPMGAQMDLSSPFTEVPCAPYGGLLLHRNTIEAIGLPDAAMVLYQDDIEYTMRISSTGRKIYLARDSHVRDAEPMWPHEGSGRGPMLFMTAGDDRRIYYYVRNRALLDRKQARSRWEKTALAINSAAYAAYSLFAALRSRHPRYWRIVLQAMVHGHRGDLRHSPPLA